MLAASFRSLGPILTVGLLASTPALADDLLPESTDLAAPAPDLAAAFAPQQTRLRRALLGDQMKGASLPKGARLQDDAPVPEGTPGGALRFEFTTDPFTGAAIDVMDPAWRKHWHSAANGRPVTGIELVPCAPLARSAVHRQGP